MSLRVSLSQAPNRKELTVEAFLLSTGLLLVINQGIPKFAEKGEFDSPCFIGFVVDASSPSFNLSRARCRHPQLLPEISVCGAAPLEDAPEFVGVGLGGVPE